MAKTTLETQLARLRRAKEAIEKKEKALLNRTQGKAIDKIVEIATQNAITPEQIVAALNSGRRPKPKSPRTDRKPSTAGGKVAPKYRNPANPEQLWTGRGRAPSWAQELRLNGTLDSARIQID
jgi:DNA-binding protein H-NS